MMQKEEGSGMRRRCCERKRRIKRLLITTIGAVLAALFLYCVPWWVFLLIGGVSLIAAGFLLFCDG